MRRSIGAVLAFAAVLGWVATAAAEHHAVKVAQKEGVGSYLADTEGMTLYWFKKDAPGTSACAGPCLEKWPLYHREQVKAPEGVPAGDFGTITRADGQKQTTFRGYPLYYWFNDKAAGDTLGQGVNDVWFVVDPANFPPK